MNEQTTTTIREEFDQNGYVVVANLLDDELDLQPIFDDYEALLDQLTTRWHAAFDLWRPAF